MRKERERALKMPWMNCFCRGSALWPPFQCWAELQEAGVCGRSNSQLLVSRLGQVCPQEGVLCSPGLICLSLQAVEGRGPGAQPRPWTHKGGDWPESCSQILFLKICCSHSNRVRKQEATQRKEVQRERLHREKINSQISSTNQLILLTSGRVGNGNREDFKYFYFHEIYNPNSIGICLYSV